MEYMSYQHLVKLGHVEVKGLEDGTCYIFPKIDGTNSLCYYNPNSENNIENICAGSRNRELSLENDNGGFFEFISKNKNIIKFLNENKNLIIYGEWLIPHSLKTYYPNSWRQFYIFDVVELIPQTESFRYLPYEEYVDFFNNDEFINSGVHVIPPICKIVNPTMDQLMANLEKNTYLIKDGEGFGEGVVVKNYNFTNRFGRTIWGKIVRNDFKNKNTLSFGVNEIKNTVLSENNIVDMAITKPLVEKEIWKILRQKNSEIDENTQILDLWTTRYIPQLLGVMWHVLLTEELAECIKKLKNPTVDFKRLQNLTNQKIKELKPDLF